MIAGNFVPLRLTEQSKPAARSCGLRRTCPPKHRQAPIDTPLAWQRVGFPYLGLIANPIVSFKALEVVDKASGYAQEVSS